jgi:arginine/ornithine transport system substrate-binding protein
MKKIVLSVLVVLAVLTCGAAIWQWRNYIVPLKIGIEGNYPPFTKTEADGSVTGFEIDLANALCKRMRARCELVKTGFDDLIPRLHGGQLDAVIASLTITEKRQKEVDFSDTYYDVPSAWFAAAGSIGSVLPGAMGGKTVAVLKGSP